MPSGTFWTVKLLDGCEVSIDCCSIGHIHMRVFELKYIKYPDIAFLGDLHVQNRTLVGRLFYAPCKEDTKKSLANEDNISHWLEIDP